MNGLKHLLLLLSFSLLGACSFLQSFHTQTPEHVEALIRAKDYGKAQKILQHVNTTHPDYTKLMAQKKRLQKLSRKLETDTLALLERLQKQNEWQQALQILNEARATLPQSQVLRQAEKTFLTARQKRINELNMKLDIHKGIWLRDAEPLLDAIVHTQPNNYERRQQQQAFSQEKARTLRNLVRCAREAMDEELYELGRRCLELSREFDSKGKYHAELKQAEEKLRHHDQAWQQQQNRISEALIEELRQGYSHDKLLRASRHLRKLSSRKQTGKGKKYSDQLRQEIDKGIAQRMDAGRRLYSEGKITEALRIWTSLRPITPDNEALEAHISRAQRVLEKLERLGKQQPSRVD